MAALSMDLDQPFDLWTEVRAAMRDAVRSPGVLAVLIICSTILGLALVGGVVWLAWAQRDATTMLSLVSLLINGLMYKRLSDVDGRVRGVEQNTNGHTTRLMDAALSQKES